MRPAVFWAAFADKLVERYSRASDSLADLARSAESGHRKIARISVKVGASRRSSDCGIELSGTKCTVNMDRSNQASNLLQSRCKIDQICNLFRSWIICNPLAYSSLRGGELRKSEVLREIHVVTKATHAPA